MKSNTNLKFDNTDFSLPCTDTMWKRYLEYKKRLQLNNLYMPSLYWKQREESFNVWFENGFVYLNGLYNRDISKELNIGNILQKLLLRIDIYKRFLLKIFFFKKSKAPLQSMNSRDDYIQNRKNTYDKNYKNLVKSLLGNNYEPIHETVYAKHMDIINCLKNNTNPDQRKSFIEIGSGSGLLAFLLVKILGFKKANLIDLPIMIPICFFWISSIVGEDMVALPGEKITNKIIFRLWIAGDCKLENNSSDLVINVTSFQEMNHKLVKEYFYKIKKWLTPKGFFMCVNRWSKATDFWLYPYSLFKNSKTILFDECLTSRHSSLKKIIVRKLIQLQD